MEQILREKYLDVKFRLVEQWKRAFFFFFFSIEIRFQLNTSFNWKSSLEKSTRSDLFQRNHLKIENDFLLFYSWLISVHFQQWQWDFAPIIFNSFFFSTSRHFLLEMSVNLVRLSTQSMWFVVTRWKFEGQGQKSIFFPSLMLI